MKLKTRVVGFGALVGIATVYVILHVTTVKTPIEPLSADTRGIDQLPGLPNLFGHLVVPRHDLDISNATGDSSALREAASIVNLSDSKLVEYLMRSDTFKKKDVVNSILRVAHAIENYRQKLPPVNEEFVPDARGERTQEGAVPADVRGRGGPDHHHRRGNPSREEAAAGGVGIRTQMSDINPNKADPGLNVVVAPEVIKNFAKIVEAVTASHRKQPRRRGPTLNVYPEGPEMPAWQRFHNRISQHEMYSEEAGMVDEVLADLATLPITNAVQKSGGTQLKITFTFSDHSRAMWKPMRFSRERETLPDHMYFVDFERHNAEIAAFHLDRVLGFRRVIPAVGREINVTRDVKELAPYEMVKTFFVSPAGNVCFHGKCDYYCDTGHAVCGHPEMLEGSFASYLPSTTLVRRKTWRNPWRRSYHKRRLAEWQTDSAFCEGVRETPPYDSGRRLLDLMDLTAFDFLTGNMDRHHYETFLDFGNYTFLIALDNGRGFGKPHHDQIDILAPIYQCCLFRFSTLAKMLNFHLGEHKLSDAVRASMARDPANPLLTEGHLSALDRRIKIILNTLHACISRNDGDYSSVIVDDGF